jgi:hypothetical protein
MDMGPERLATWIQSHRRRNNEDTLEENCGGDVEDLYEL